MVAMSHLTLLHAQSDTGRYIHRHLVRGVATIAPGFMTDGGNLHIYLHGNLEYYLDERISLRGDGFYFLSAAKGNAWLQNHSILSGASLHMGNKNRFDPYIGLQPGVAISQLAFGGPCALYPCLVASPGYTKANPIISPVIGFNYYFEKLFHLFGEARYVAGKHLADAPTYSLSELKFSFGLGWNVN